MRTRLKGINTVRAKLADGTEATYYYHRATGTRLTGAPGTPEFLASFQSAARSAAQERSAGTVSWLIRQYQDSKQYTRLADSTREIARLNLKAVEDKWGATPLEHAQAPRTRPIFLRWHDKLAETHPRAADAKLAALARVLSWGVDRGHITNNPVSTFERAYRAERAEMIWLPEHVTAFEDAAAPELRLALILALHTGQRQADLLALPWSAYDGKAITLRQGKSRRAVYVPATRALRAALDAAPRRATTILVTDRGTPWKKRNFHEHWSEATRKAGITVDLHFHDLRGTAVTMLAEAGCTVPEIATITGHSQAHAQKILERYLARTRSLAEAAIVKLEGHRRNQGQQNGLQNGSKAST
ncbi:tyrosine-type recombinase/integrase [Methylobacterium indicum]|uniref:Integrase n=1 Tax=Methylobacterium indicum TaxID=1775910 RepID=A0ABR5HEN1_9HYPH|nr:tyrosine-type recombinase/integrase [Methylobacterium indicum]KMO18863.1 integrase [Methylobacterium indicum]KMO25021.1 integrase [Methylobacterium indicum]